MNHKELDVWKEGIVLVKKIYELTKSFPKEELYGIVSQLRRAVVSVPTNIAEGCSRKSDKETIHFLYIAVGSLSEIETLFIISEDLGYIENIDIIIKDLDILRKKIMALIKYLSNKEK